MEAIGCEKLGPNGTVHMTSCATWFHHYQVHSGNPCVAPFARLVFHV